MVISSFIPQGTIRFNSSLNLGSKVCGFSKKVESKFLVFENYKRKLQEKQKWRKGYMKNQE
jgi:hypothetical protein